MKYKKELSAGGIVYKKVGSQVLWLITRHSQHKGWGFPKGLIADGDKNETMDVAALREVKEEGGIEARIAYDDPVTVSYKYRFEDFLVDKTVYYFLMEYISGDPKDHDWEVSDAKFIPGDEVHKTLTFKSDQQAFRDIMKLLRV